MLCQRPGVCHILVSCQTMNDVLYQPKYTWTVAVFALKLSYQIMVQYWSDVEQPADLMIGSSNSSSNFFNSDSFLMLFNTPQQPVKVKCCQSCLNIARI